MLLKEPWKEVDSYKNKTKYVPIKWLKQFKGNSFRRNEVEMNELLEDIRKNGLQHPLWIEVGRQNKKVKLGEGNHRLEIAERLKCEMVPIIVGLQNNAYQGAGYEPYDYPFLVEHIEEIERGLIHPDKVFSKYEMIKINER